MTAEQLEQRAMSIRGSGDYDSDTQRNRAMIAGVTVGVLFGLYYGYIKKKNLLIMGAAGAIIGGITSRVLMPKN